VAYLNPAAKAKRRAENKRRFARGEPTMGAVPEGGYNPAEFYRSLILTPERNGKSDPGSDLPQASETPKGTSNPPEHVNGEICGRIIPSSELEHVNGNGAEIPTPESLTPGPEPAKARNNRWAGVQPRDDRREAAASTPAAPVAGWLTGGDGAGEPQGSFGARARRAAACEDPADARWYGGGGLPCRCALYGCALVVYDGRSVSCWKCGH
jgi:hypothetical protein